jgi:serine/threonine protein kinase
LAPPRITDTLGPDNWIRVRHLRAPRNNKPAVYLVQHRETGAPGAMKLLPPELQVDKAERVFFYEQAKFLRAASHENIVQVFDYGETAEGQRFLVMEYVEGETLERLLTTKVISYEEGLGVLAQLASAVAHAHRRGAVHRCIQPDNVLCTRSGMAKLIDWGLCKLAQRGDGHRESQHVRLRMMLNARYAAPEVLEAAGALSFDEWRRCDVLSLGRLAPSLLSRHPPGGISARAEDILRLARELEPRKRPEASEVARVLGEERERLAPRARIGPATTTLRDEAASLGAEEHPESQENRERLLTGARLCLSRGFGSAQLVDRVRWAELLEVASAAAAWMRKMVGDARWHRDALELALQGFAEERMRMTTAPVPAADLFRGVNETIPGYLQVIVRATNEGAGVWCTAIDGALHGCLADIAEEVHHLRRLPGFPADVADWLDALAPIIGSLLISR